MRTRSALLAGSLVAALAFVAVILWSQAADSAEPSQAGQRAAQPARTGETHTSAQEDRGEDRAAIRKTVQGLVEAFERGDAAQVAAHLTSGAELISDEFPPVRGRQTIQAALTVQLPTLPKRKITLDVDSLRFPSRDTAVEEGHIHANVDGADAPAQRYRLLLVREDGKWLVGILREWRSEVSELRDLGWLVGTWEARQPQGELTATYEWFGDKAFLRATIKARFRARTYSGTQYIGVDPQTGGLKVWVFESNGSFSEGTCKRDGDAWLLNTRGVEADGDPITATNILLRVNNDTITWQPVNIVRGEERIGDGPPIKVTRVKAAK